MVFFALFRMKGNIWYVMLTCLLSFVAIPSFSQTDPDAIKGANAQSKDSADFYFARAKKNITNKLLEAEFYLAKTAYFSYAKDDSTFYFGNITIDLCKKLNRGDYIANVYYIFSTIYTTRGENDKSINALFTGLQYAEQNKSDFWIANLNSYLALNFHDAEEYSKGVIYGKRAFAYAVKNNLKKESITRALSIIAINFDDWNKPDSALYYNFKILDYYKGKDTPNLDNVYNNIGNTLLKQQKYSEAKKWITRSLNLRISHGDSVSPNEHYNIATNYTNLATIAYETENYQEASQYFALAFASAEKSGSIEKLRDYYYRFYQFNKKIKSFEKALDAQDKYLGFRDSVYNTERIAISNNLEIKYQTEKKEAQIKLLNKENSITQLKLKQGNLMLTGISLLFAILILLALSYYKRYKSRQRSLLQAEAFKQQKIATQSLFEGEQKERIRIARDLHDSIGQMLSVVKMHVSAIHSEVTGDSKKTTATSLDLVDKTIGEVRNISHNLIPEELHFGLIAAIDSLCSQLNAAGSVNVTLETDDNTKHLKLTKQTELSVYRIVQEVLGNMAKHAEATEIVVSIYNNDNTIYLRLKDNGKGFDTGQINQSKGMGWKNIYARVNLLNGKMNIQSEKITGTQIEISLPE